MSRVVHLHVGAPKTGTTYVQSRLALNADSLAQHDVHFPTGSRLVAPDLFHFRAALDLLGQDWGGPEGHAAGAWSTLARRARRLRGNVIVSHEILAPARSEHVARVRKDLGDAEVHVVYSVRDLGRQLPAAWQESLKQGRSWRYHRFLGRVAQGKNWWYHALDLPRVLSTWGAGLPPEQIHLVTVPPRQTPDGRPVPRDLLWRRTCEAFRIDPAWAPLESEQANESLGVVEAELIRRLNKRIDRPVRREATTDHLIRDILAQEHLAHRDSSRLQVPPKFRAWAEERTEEWIEWIEASGVHVIGDVADLRPVWEPEEDYRNPAKTRARHLLGVALDSLETMTMEAARRPDPDRPLGSKLMVGVDRLRGR